MAHIKDSSPFKGHGSIKLAFGGIGSKMKTCKGMAGADSKYCLEAWELNPITNFMLGSWVEASHFIVAAPLQRDGRC